MFDTHVNYYHVIQRCITKDPPLAFSLTQQWQYEDRINESVVRKLVQTSHLRGFTGILSIGTCIGCDTALSMGVPLPRWASLVQSTSTASSGSDHTEEEVDAVDEDEVNINTSLVVQLMEQISTSNNL